jgi:hypothetical protein
MAVWRHKINIKQHLSDDDGKASKAATGILTELAKLTRKREFEDDIELDQIREEFQGIADNPKATDGELNDVLDRFYDWADVERVWCGL